MQECSAILSSTSSRDFIHTILCSKPKAYAYYQKACLDGTCPRCVGMSLLSKCVHVSDDHGLGQMEVNLQRFQYVTYDFKGGKSGRKIQLVSTQVSSYCTIKSYIFSLKYIYKYAFTL